MPCRQKRPDQNGSHRAQFDKNKKRIYATERACGICGEPVDFSKKYPDPMAPCIDHIIPISKGGHPSDLSNLQLAHWWCNRQKSDKLYSEAQKKTENKEKKERLQLSRDWRHFAGE